MSLARPLPLGMTTFAWLYDASLEQVLHRMREAGLRSFELAALPAHVGDVGDSRDRDQVRRAVAASGLVPTSVNPTFVDINHISVDPLFRQASIDRMLTHIHLAEEIGAPRVVMMAGRLHALRPVRDADRVSWFDEALDKLLPAAEAAGIVLCLENSPYGYMATADDLLSVVAPRDNPHLRILYDVANALAVEDATVGVARIGRYLEFSHVSDAFVDRWAHTSPGRGDVDFDGFAEALRAAGAPGPTVYELIDGELADPRLNDDLTFLERAGWDRGGLATSHGSERSAPNGVGLDPRPMKD